MTSKNKVAFTPKLFGKWDWDEVCKEESNGSIFFDPADPESFGEFVLLAS